MCKSVCVCVSMGSVSSIIHRNDKSEPLLGSIYWNVVELISSKLFWFDPYSIMLTGLWIRYVLGNQKVGNGRWKISIFNKCRSFARIFSFSLNFHPLIDLLRLTNSHIFSSLIVLEAFACSSQFKFLDRPPLSSPTA